MRRLITRIAAGVTVIALGACGSTAQRSSSVIQHNRAVVNTIAEQRAQDDRAETAYTRVFARERGDGKSHHPDFQTHAWVDDELGIPPNRLFEPTWFSGRGSVRCSSF